MRRRTRREVVALEEIREKFERERRQIAHGLARRRGEFCPCFPCQQTKRMIERGEYAA